MDRLADGLQKLNEDDLLQVVQMVHDNKAADSYTKNDVERKFPSALKCIIYPSILMSTHSWGIPCGSVHPTRRIDQNALGFHGGARCPLGDLKPFKIRRARDISSVLAFHAHSFSVTIRLVTSLS